MKATPLWRRPVVVVPAVLILMAVLGIAGLRFFSRSGVKEQLAAIQARGLPVTARELDAWYKHVPDAENRALVILRVSENFVEPTRGKDPTLYGWRDMQLDAPLDPGILAAIEDYVGKNAELLEQLHAAAALPSSRYPVDLTKAPDLSLRALAPIKRASQILRLEAILQAEKSDSSGALRSLMTGFAVAGSLSEEPLIISDLVRMACLAIHLTAVEQALTRARFDDSALVALETAARKAEADGRRAIYRATVGERAFGIATFKAINAKNFTEAMAWGGLPPWLEKIPEPLRPLAFSVRRGLGMYDADLGFYIEAMGEIEKATELDFAAMLSETTNIFARVAADIDTHPVRLMMSRFVLPALAKVPEKEVLLASRLRCVVAAVNVERFRLRHGRAPSAVEIGAPAFPDWPRDASDNQPLRFESLQPKGFRVVAVHASVLANEGRAQSSTNWQDVAISVLR